MAPGWFQDLVVQSWLVGMIVPSWFQILIVVVLIVLLFGRGKISEMMGDVAKGIKSFKKGMSEDEPAKDEPARTIEHERTAETSAQSREKNKAT